MLSAPAAAAGLVLGAGLSWLLVPTVTRTGLGLLPFPPVQAASSSESRSPAPWRSVRTC